MSPFSDMLVLMYEIIGLIFWRLKEDWTKAFEDASLLASNRFHLVFWKYHSPFSSVTSWHHRPTQNAIHYRTIYLQLPLYHPAETIIYLNPKLVRYDYMKPYQFQSINQYLQYHHKKSPQKVNFFPIIPDNTNWWSSNNLSKQRENDANQNE